MVKKQALVITLLTLVILTVGCSSETESAIENENIIVIKSVLQQQFTTDQEWVELYEKVSTLVEQIPPDLELIEKIITEGDSYIETKYKSYFTENMYEKFIILYATQFQIYTNFIFNVESVDVIQNEFTKGAYDFTVNVIYKKGNEEEKKAKVIGRAHIYEQGKISNIDYRDYGGLYEALKER
ncbi:hypothetical protein VQL36_18550 [Chengkuizengella sp. SCS-71B]|uniref:hypothetical protein n=1 Tax=Chengkuizengella sp. SCS-71B TaxID=3115290 RepID=UPI0032C21FF9